MLRNRLFNNKTREKEPSRNYSSASAQNNSKAPFMPIQKENFRTYLQKELIKFIEPSDEESTMFVIHMAQSRMIANLYLKYELNRSELKDIDVLPLVCDHIFEGIHIRGFKDELFDDLRQLLRQTVRQYFELPKNAKTEIIKEKAEDYINAERARNCVNSSLMDQTEKQIGDLQHSHRAKL